MNVASPPIAPRARGLAVARGGAVRAVRPRLAVAWLAALLLATLVLRHPMALAGLLGVVLWLGASLGAGAALWRLLRWAVPFAALLVVIQVLIDRNGLTVIARLGASGLLGELDLTLEALVGAITQALRVLGAIAISALSLALVDVDRVLASVRRRVPRLGVAATLALRLAPTLAADGGRYADGLRARADGGRLDARDRVRVVEAVLHRTLDRAADAAAILELRGLASPKRGPRTRALPWSRTEQGAAVAAAASLGALVAVELAGADRFSAFPLLTGVSAWTGLGAGLLVGFAAAVPLVAVARHEVGA